MAHFWAKFGPNPRTLSKFGQICPFKGKFGLARAFFSPEKGMATIFLPQKIKLQLDIFRQKCRCHPFFWAEKGEGQACAARINYSEKDSQLRIFLRKFFRNFFSEKSQISEIFQKSDFGSFLGQNRQIGRPTRATTSHKSQFSQTLKDERPGPTPKFAVSRKKSTFLSIFADFCRLSANFASKFALSRQFWPNFGRPRSKFGQKSTFF